jgi:predicted NBD/HSP70 family sugar kinase
VQNTVHISRLRPAEQLVVASLRERPGATRAQLARLIGLPKSTVTGVVARLIETGTVLELPLDGAGERKRGRPAAGLVVAEPGLVAALAISHSSTRVAVLDAQGRILVHRAEERATSADPEDRVASALRLFDAALADHAARSADGQPGTETRTRPGTGTEPPPVPITVRQAVIGLPVPVHEIEGATPMRANRAGHLRRIAELREDGLGLSADPVGQVVSHLRVPTVAANDVNLGALGEARFGAGRGFDSFVYLKVVDGIGAGLILDGRLYRGATGVAGELAHVHTHDGGPLCLCGARGCLATAIYVAPSLLATIQAAYRDPLTWVDVIELCANGDQGVRRILADLGRQLGVVLADFCVMINPAAVIVDGMLEQAAEPVVEGIRESIDRRTPPMISRPLEVLAGTLGDRAELLGAVALS